MKSNIWQHFFCLLGYVRRSFWCILWVWVWSLSWCCINSNHFTFDLLSGLALVCFILLNMASIGNCQTVAPTSDQKTGIETTQPAINTPLSTPPSTTMNPGSAGSGSSQTNLSPTTDGIANTTQIKETCSKSSDLCEHVTAQFNLSLSGDQYCDIEMAASAFEEVMEKSDCRKNYYNRTQLLQYSDISVCSDCEVSTARFKWDSASSVLVTAHHEWM